MNRIFVIGLLWPEPDSSAAGAHMMQLLDGFLDSGHDIHFAATSNRTKRSENLESLGITTHQIRVNDSKFDKLLTSIDPDMVVFDRFMTEEQFGWRVAKTIPDAIRILNTEDLHFLRKGREMAVLRGGDLQPGDLENEQTMRELACIIRSDLSLIISAAEIERLIDHFGIDPQLLCYLPFMFDRIDDDVISSFPGFKERSHFIWIGNFRHAPNTDAIDYLRSSIWPEIRLRLPQAEVHIYGAYTNKEHLRLDDPVNGFRIKGFAENIEQLMPSYRACLVPLRFGAGLKGKLFSAMQNGTPFITTEIGAEGLPDREQLEEFIGLDKADFIEKTIRIYTVESKWKQAVEVGFELINSHFTKVQHQPEMMTRLKHLKENLITHRKGDFIQDMLKHHSFRASEYMSKWIELKNSK